MAHKTITFTHLTLLIPQIISTPAIWELRYSRVQAKSYSKKFLVRTVDTNQLPRIWVLNEHVERRHFLGQGVVDEVQTAPFALGVGFLIPCGELMARLYTS